MDNKEDLYRIIELKLSAHKTPVFKEEKNKEWVIYGTDAEGGYKNNYPGYLLYLYNRSGKHNAFINGKVHYICGNGVAFDTNGLSMEQIAIANAFLNKPNQNGDTLKQVVKKCVLDKKLFGGFYLELILAKNGKDFEILHCPYNNIRKAKDDDGYYYSKDWTKQKQSEEDTGLTYIDAFDPDDVPKRSIYCCKEYRPDLDYYPLPDYIASAVYAEIDVEISNYRLNAIKSGFNAGTLINFNNGKPSDKEKEGLEAAFKEKFEGTDQANSILITFSQSKENAPTITRLAPQNVDEQLDGLNVQVMQELITGHRITNPALVGISTPGKLGEDNNTDESFELMRGAYIVPNQREIEEVFNYLLGFKGFSHRLYLKDVPAVDDKPTPEQKWEVMTENEKRVWAGLPEIEEKPSKIVSSTVHRFSKEQEEEFAEQEAEVFRQYGEDLETYDFVSKRFDFSATNLDEVFESEIKDYSFDILEGDVKLLYRNIIDLLKKDPLMPNDMIAKTLKTNLNRVSVAIERLIKEGAINTGTKVSGDQETITRTPTKEAIKIIDKQGSSTSELKIMYTYEPRPGLKPVIENTRPFCKKLIDAKKIYTRQQIEQISNIVGYDVWTKRGGWWTQKGGAITTPFCRHVWVQNLVRKKS